MEAIRALIDALYTRLVLRDFVGKVIPGAIALLSLGQRLTPARAFVTNLGVPTIVLVGLGIGVSWIIALALQSAGEALRIIRYWPSDYAATRARYDLRLRFQRVATPDEKQQAERFSVILEASALSSMALLVATLVGVSLLVSPTAAFALAPPLEISFLVIVLAAAAMSLWRLHRTHAAKLYTFMEAVLDIPRAVPMQVGVSEERVTSVTAPHVL